LRGEIVGIEPSQNLAGLDIIAFLDQNSGKPSADFAGDIGLRSLKPAIAADHAAGQGLALQEKPERRSAKRNKQHKGNSAHGRCPAP
jgi:hypothetical protein